jgi:uncharacterized protein YuzE
VIRVELDAEANAVYVRLSDASVARTVDANRDVLVDLDERGATVGVEVLGVGPVPGEIGPARDRAFRRMVRLGEELGLYGNDDQG